MKKILILTTLISHFLYANSGNYCVQLGVFKNNPFIVPKLKQLIDEQKAFVHENNSMYYLVSKKYTTEKEAQKHIKDFSFNDSYVTKRCFNESTKEKLFVKPPEHNKTEKNSKEFILNKESNSIDKVNIKKYQEIEKTVLEDTSTNQINQLARSLKEDYIDFEDKHIYDVDMYKQLTQENHEEYLKILNEKTPFLGFYFIGNVEKDFDGDFAKDGTRYDFRLEWELFNDGYFEAKKQNAEKMNETKVQYYQLMKDMNSMRHDEFLSEVLNMLNTSRFFYHLKLGHLYHSLYEKRDFGVKYGYNEVMDVEKIKTNMENEKNHIEMYKQYKDFHIDKQTFLMINMIETIELKTLDVLLEETFQNSYDLKLQETFITRADFHEEWKDRFKFNVYVRHRNTDFNDGRNSIGLNFQIPLHFNEKRDELVHIEKQNYVYQREAIKIRMKEKIHSVLRQFSVAKTQLYNLENDVKQLKYEYEIENIKSEKKISTFKYDPKRQKDLILIDITTKTQEIVEKRFEMLTLLYELYFLSGKDKLTDLLKK